MVYVKWTFLAVIAVLIGAFLHYTLPQHDVVRINRAYETQVTVGDNALFWAGTAPGEGSPGAQRYVNLIETFTPEGKVIVFRNEDTGWGWPPYFKFDTSNLQAEAGDLKSSKDNPQWVVVTHYGWRNEYLSIYPNAVGIRAVDRPDVTIIPWLNILILGTLTVIAAWIWRVLARFREDRIEPLIDEAGDFIDSVDDRAENLWQRLFGRR
ncbi:uncharacterized protein DUF1523 [Rhodovulum bhavnagarense]|uniref:Uncharacterized protein DUF1523 n=1 Tax=Rhodovulum bhavnagarense TaxID=992286 RepID=A0A4R2RGM5_9RHOB|nr:DUF1523 family protein [Rhodovulum bhavnagarense]TCP61559.1 uncharacterized protein DUF1523 [Rhodovulum bhavnagarense]